MRKAAPSECQTNAEIARRLVKMAQMLQAQGENPYKVRAYRRAAEVITGLSNSIDEQVKAGADVTRYPGIGKGIAAALREIVLSGRLGQLEMLLAAAPPEVAALNEFPRLDPKRVARAYKKLKIGTLAELRALLDAGRVEEVLGRAMAQHFRDALTDRQEMLLVDAEPVAAEIDCTVPLNFWPE